MTSDLNARLGVKRANGFELAIDLEIPAGTTAALLGPNGAGKSTAVDGLAGIRALDSGSIRLGDRVLDDRERGVFEPPELRRVGVVFQQYLLFDHLSVADNVAFGPLALGRSRAKASAIAADWLERLDLVALADRRPDELSGGQAQRVALARALATDPELLLLDEPLAALDVETRSAMRRTLREHLAAYEGPRLLITHDPTDAFLLADTIHILEDGHITQVGTPDEIRRTPATPYVAALAGVNLLSGRNDGGALTLDDHDQPLSTADTSTNGGVLIIIRPNAIALHGEEPHGSPRNSWKTSIDTLEPLGDITRVILDGPLPLSVDVTPNAVSAMGLSAGSPVWASVKATEINVNPA